MREIYYNSDITPKADNEIKLLALYYDRINIVNDVVYVPKFEKVDGKVQFAGSKTCIVFYFGLYVFAGQLRFK